MKVSRFTTFFLLIFFACGTALSQDSPRDRGIALYKQGDTDQAIKLLEAASGLTASGSDAELWNYLGMAYLKKQETKKGRLALEKAVQLDPGNLSYRSFLAYAYLLDKQEKKARAEADKVLSLDPKNVWAYYVRGRAQLNDSHFDEAIADAGKMLELDPKSSQAYTVKSDAIFGKFIERLKGGSSIKNGQELLQEAGSTLRECMRSCLNNTEAEVQQQKLDIIEAFNEAVARRAGGDVQVDKGPVADSRRVKIISKPMAHYTEEARKNFISGTIKVMVLFGAEGSIPYVILLNRLGSGLDEVVERAARSIKFNPAMLNGRPVPSVTTIEYGFSVR